MRSMDDVDPLYVPLIDPRTLVPFECRLEPDDPMVVKLPRAYRGSIEKDFLNTENRSGKI